MSWSPCDHAATATIKVEVSDASGAWQYRVRATLPHASADAQVVLAAANPCGADGAWVVQHSTATGGSPPANFYGAWTAWPTAGNATISVRYDDPAGTATISKILVNQANGLYGPGQTCDGSCGNCR